MTQLTPDSCPDCSPIRLQIPLNCISQVSVVLGVHLLLVPVLTLTPFQGKLKSLGGRTPRREDSNLQMPWRQAWPPLWPLSLSAQDPMKRDLGFSHPHPQPSLSNGLIYSFIPVSHHFSSMKFGSKSWTKNWTLTVQGAGNKGLRGILHPHRWVRCESAILTSLGRLPEILPITQPPEDFQAALPWDVGMGPCQASSAHLACCLRAALGSALSWNESHSSPTSNPLKGRFQWKGCSQAPFPDGLTSHLPFLWQLISLTWLDWEMLRRLEKHTSGCVCEDGSKED